jgi:hypothetical protein
MVVSERRAAARDRLQSLHDRRSLRQVDRQLTAAVFLLACRQNEVGRLLGVGLLSRHRQITRAMDILTHEFATGAICPLRCRVII